MNLLLVLLALTLLPTINGFVFSRRFFQQNELFYNVIITVVTFVIIDVVALLGTGFAIGGSGQLNGLLLLSTISAIPIHMVFVLTLPYGLAHLSQHLLRKTKLHTYGWIIGLLLGSAIVSGFIYAFFAWIGSGLGEFN
jgi:hypothetical protein